MFDMDAPIVKVKDMQWKMVDGLTIVLNADDNVLLKLDAVGTAVWEMIDGEKSGAEISFLLTEQFEVDFARARRDVEGFLKMLWADEVIECLKREDKKTWSLWRKLFGSLLKWSRV